MSNMLLSTVGTVVVTNLFLWLLLRFSDLVHESYAEKKQEQQHQEKENELTEAFNKV